MLIIKRLKLLVARLIFRLSFLTGYRVPIGFIRSVDIEPIAACNLKCPFCQVPTWNRSCETKPMSLSLFRKLIDQMPNLKHLKLQGMGEPFLNPNLVEMIKIADNKGIKTLVVTNGTLLTQELISKILDMKQLTIAISFDSATKEIYEQSRVGAHFESVVNNIKTLCSLKNGKRSNIEVKIISLITSNNMLTEIPLIIKASAQWGIRDVLVKKRLKNWKRDSLGKGYTFTTTYIDNFHDYENILLESHKLAKQLGVKFNLVEDSDYSYFSFCLWPWSSLYISTEGKVVPCCAIGIPETLTMGDLAKEDLVDVWNNAAYRKLRKQISKNQIPELCKACYRN